MMLQFLMDYSRVVLELSRLLDLTFVQSSPGMETRIGKAVASVLGYWNKHEHEKALWELSRLALLAKHLAEIEMHDKALFESFKKQFRDARLDRDRYFGLRFEANITASLIRKGQAFRKAESPDFEVVVGSESVYIECGSAHFSQGKQADFWQKMGVAIKKKAGKPYAGQHTSLFLDITNVYSSALLQGTLPAKDIMKREVWRILRGAPGFGNVTLFMTIFNKARNRIESNYVRVDSEAATKTLVQFLDSTFPVGEHVVADYALPSEP